MKKAVLISLFCVFSFLGIYFFFAVYCPMALAEEGSGAQKKIKYWTCGMHPQIKQDKPGNCPICNMNLIPLYEEDSRQQASLQPQKKRILYYRNPMNPSMTSDIPLKDSMGMDYLPVYDEESSAIKLSPRDIELAGIKTDRVRRLPLFKEIRTVGRVAYDPELYKAEEEFIQAVIARENLEKSQSPETRQRSYSLIEASKLKLRLLGLSDKQIEKLAKDGGPDRGLIISDELSPYVWIYADIYEYELSWIKESLAVRVSSASYPGEEFRGEIAAIDPLLNPMTRSARIRVRIENPEFKLKPQMYVDIFIQAYLVDEDNRQKEVLAVSKDAVLDTGMRKVVYLDLGNGAYSGQEVQVGPGAVSFIDGKKEKFYPVIRGLKEGDIVVTKANFLLDSQSQITGVGAAAAYGGALEKK